MVLDGKTNFFLGKKWFWTGKPTEPWEKDGFGQKKTNFFLGKTKQTKKTIFWETMRPNSKKMVFLVFPRKKLVFLPKTIFFLGKSWFWTEKPSFS